MATGKAKTENACLPPAHTCSLEPTLSDMLTRPLDDTGAHGESAVPGLPIPDTSPVVLYIADRLDQGVVNGLFPGLYLLEGTQDHPDIVGEQRSEFLFLSGLGPPRVVGVLERGEGEGWCLRDVLHKPFGTLKELLNDEIMVHGCLLRKKSKAEGFTRIIRGQSTYNLKVRPVSSDFRALRFQQPSLYPGDYLGTTDPDIEN